MSKTSQIIDAIEANILSVLPNYKKAPYRYTFDKCGSNGNDNVFRVAQAQGQSESIVSRQISQTKEFKISLSKEFVLRDGDEDLQDKIKEIEDDFEKLIKSAVSSNFGSNLISNIVSFTTPDPEIDYGEMTVSLMTNFNINFIMRY